jgi:hypothetical protein
MPIEHMLACYHCREFISTADWCINVDLRADFPRGFAGKPVRSESLLGALTTALADDALSRYQELIPCLKDFIERHSSHDLRMQDEGSDAPWDPEHPGYCGWKLIVATRYGDPELYLPRNLVDDLHLKTWPRAKAHLQTLTINLYEELELQEYQAKFRELTT